MIVLMTCDFDFGIYSINYHDWRMEYAKKQEKELEVERKKQEHNPYFNKYVDKHLKEAQAQGTP